MTDAKDLTKAQWRRRALAAEKELESIQRIRMFDRDHEMRMHQQLAEHKVAMIELKALLEWVNRNDEPSESLKWPEIKGPMP